MTKRVGCFMPGQVSDAQRQAALVQHLLEARLARGQHVEAARIRTRGAAATLPGSCAARILNRGPRSRDLLGGLRGARVVLGTVGEEEDDVVALPVDAGRVVDAVDGLRGRAVVSGTV